MPSVTKFYQLKNDSTSVRMDFKVGQAGQSVTTVTLGGVKINGDFNNSFDLDLGPNKILIGKRLEVRSVVGKIIPGNNHTFVEVTLSGGKENQVFPKPDDSGENPVIFDYTFFLNL